MTSAISPVLRGLHSPIPLEESPHQQAVHSANEIRRVCILQLALTNASCRYITSGEVEGWEHRT